MNSSPSRPVLLLLACALIAALLAGCGGSDEGGDESTDPQELLEKTFGSDVQIDSGSLDISVQASTSGSEDGSLDASLTGPFASNGDGELPDLDLDVGFDVKGGGQDQTVEAGVVITDDQGFVTVDGTDYVADDATFASFKDSYAQSAAQADQGGEADQGSALLSQLGVDPATWLTDVTNEGIEEIEGAETVHISGTADIAQIVADAGTLAEAGGEAAGLSPEDVGQLENAVKSAQVDVFTGAEDNILRRLDLNLEIDEPGGGGSLSVALSIGINDVNQPQEFVAPENAKPLEELLPGGFGSLGALGAGAASGGADSAPVDPSAGAGGGSPSGTVPGGLTPEYLNCLDEAGASQAAIAKCGSLLGE